MEFDPVQKYFMGQKVFDRSGRSYILSTQEVESMLFLRLYDSNTFVGEAKCVLESLETLLLGDIWIANDVIPEPTSIWAKFFREISRYQPKAVSYRAVGLGSVLLKALINHARKSGVQILYGNVYRRDLENNPKLLKWYQKHGFEVKPPTLGNKPDIVAVVCLDVGVNPASTQP